MDTCKEVDTEPSRKKRRLDAPMGHIITAPLSVHAANVAQFPASPAKAEEASPTASTAVIDNPATLLSLDRSISPPKNGGSRYDFNAGKSLDVAAAAPVEEIIDNESTVIPSPVQLTRIADLNASNNVDTIGLGEILGDPLIKECWQFNYLFNVDFLMDHFDEDVRSLVQVKIVHGSWKREDSNKIRIDEAAKRYPNLQVITAYMPEVFGTHHSKMMILFRHDDLAQVVIHTANIIPGDWGNMCQAVWRSPLLPFMPITQTQPSSSNSPALPSLGCGARFKLDLLAYLRTYGQAKTGPLTKKLQDYDFSSVRAALVASTPSKLNLRSLNPDTEHLWGWPGLRKVLGNIPVTPVAEGERSNIVVQVSSVASLGQNDKWLVSTLLDTLATSSSNHATSEPKSKPKFSIIFPTADEIRRSLDGYSSGSSIHMKTESAAQAKQVTYMRPMLCHWAGDGEQITVTQSTTPVREAGRRRAAPHIKTYIRFTDSSMTSIDWAMVTSANLSTQAWGSAANASGEVRICSYEIGVVVWPGLFDDGGGGSVDMVPAFKQDTPSMDQLSDVIKDALDDSERQRRRKTVIGFRMPYDLPLVPYGKDDLPWCATSPCSELDWMGRTWPGFGQG
ncbi:MAG: hypothetical protein M1830_008473 [Pleopsidium flavum]|nr:MAG: hypothetical protein M1830_008473 [Pleopsidium flavum]